MTFREFIKGRKIMDAPADIGQKPIRSKIVKRVCTDCKHYVEPIKYCPIVGKITKPEAAYCSWFKRKAL